MFLTAQFIASPRGSPSARITAGSMPPFAPNVRANSHACGAQTYPPPLGLEGSESLQDAIKPTRTKSVSWRDSEPPFAPDVRADSHACGAQTYPTPLGLEGLESVQDAIKPTRTKSVSWRDSEPPFAPDVRADSHACGAQTYPTPLGLEGLESVQDAIKPTRTKSVWALLELVAGFELYTACISMCFCIHFILKKGDIRRFFGVFMVSCIIE